MNTKVCECCGATYEAYKVGEESEVFGFWCEIGTGERKGLCGFCNPKSKVWYIEDKHCHKTL